MRTFIPHALDAVMLAADLDELERLLNAKVHLKERAEIAPFFKARPNLCAALSLMNAAVEAPNRIAHELDLFGDFSCDVASGDSEANAYTLVEFEDAREHSVFSRLEPGKTVRRWSPRFEHGFSQLVDWAWRLSTEGASSEAFRRIFGNSHPTIHLLLIAGRDADLTKDDFDRLRWRANHTALGAVRVSCYTFDQVLASLRRRLSSGATGAPAAESQ
jgi:Domain of unknown function (DUF4263)